MTGYAVGYSIITVLFAGDVRPVSSVLHLIPCYFPTGDQSARSVSFSIASLDP